MSIVLVFKRQKEEDHKHKGSLGYIVRHWLKTKTEAKPKKLSPGIVVSCDTGTWYAKGVCVEIQYGAF
jgi:hypothetical protein